MKYAQLCLVFLLLATNASAQTPQEIFGIAKEARSTEYYKEQAELWKKALDKTPDNSFAWYQYYKAKRAWWQKTDPAIWASNQKAILERLEPILIEAEPHINNTADYYLMQAANAPLNNRHLFYEKAFAADPDRVESYEGLLVHYVLHFENDKATAIARKMLDNNYYSNANLKWNYNGLVTVEQKGVFITHGDMDTSPKWVLQFGKGIKTDVLVVNKWLLINNAEYQEVIFRKLNMPPFEKTASDFNDALSYADAMSLYLLFNSPLPVYMSCGTDISLFKNADIMDRMYLVGLAFLYATEPFDNTAITQHNFENKYDLEYLLNNFQTHTEDEMVKRYMNVTYIPGLMKLKSVYSQKKMGQKLELVNTLIDRIADESGRRSEILSWY